jgi:hypothetical protein
MLLSRLAVAPATDYVAEAYITKSGVRWFNGIPEA